MIIKTSDGDKSVASAGVGGTGLGMLTDIMKDC